MVLRRALTVFLAVMSCLVVTGGTATAEVDEPSQEIVNDPPGTEYADDWEVTPESDDGARWGGGVCQGTFSSLINNVATVQFGALWSCTSPVFTTIQVFIQPCIRDTSGSFSCLSSLEVPGNFAAANQYMNRSDGYYNCTPGDPGYFRPVARNMGVNNVPVSNKYGTAVYSSCS